MAAIPKTSQVVGLVIITIFLIIYCTKNDHVFNNNQPINTSTDLLSLRTTVPPTLDGVVDQMWTYCTKLQFSTAVPDVTGEVFRGFTGNIIPSVTIRSAYDADNIYFLVEWNDPTQSLKRQPWYFNPVTKNWLQELGTFDFSTTPYRPPFYEDKIAFLWNINNSVNGWNTATCYRSCHTGLPAADGFSRHYTNYPGEKIDMWHWKSVRGGVNASFQVHDQYQDNTYPNGRKGDPGGDVYQNNKQTLPVTGNEATSKDVPKYIIPGRADYGWIMNSEVSNGTAKLVTAVNTNGVLTLNNGSTIDPNVGTDFQRSGNGVGPKAVPGLMLNDGYAGSGGDIPCKAIYSSGGWTLEFRRALKTNDAQYDVDFSSLVDQYFGFAIFENAQIAHSIKANLVLKFQK